MNSNETKDKTKFKEEAYFAHIEKKIESELNFPLLDKLEKVRGPFLLFFSVVFGLFAAFCLAAAVKVYLFSFSVAAITVLFSVAFSCCSLYLKKQSGY